MKHVFTIKKCHKGNVLWIFVLYVDDITIYQERKDIKFVKSEIKIVFDLSDIGLVGFIIGNSRKF